MLEIVSAALPVFFRVDDWVALVVPTSCEPKPMLDGVSVTAGARTAPVPLSGTLCGLSAALSETVTLAGREPVAVGSKRTVIVQVDPAARLDGQSFDWE